MAFEEHEKQVEKVASDESEHHPVEVAFEVVHFKVLKALLQAPPEVEVGYKQGAAHYEVEAHIHPLILVEKLAKALAGTWRAWNLVFAELVHIRTLVP